MPRKSEERPLTKHTLHLFEGQYERLKDLFPDVSTAHMIRRILEDFLLRAEPSKKWEPPPRIGVNIDV